MKIMLDGRMSDWENMGFSVDYTEGVGGITLSWAEVITDENNSLLEVVYTEAWVSAENAQQGGPAFLSTFADGFMNGPKTDGMSGSGISGAYGTLILTPLEAAVRNDGRYTSNFTKLRQVATASKYVNTAGKVLGGANLVFTGIEAFSDRNVTGGDGAKMLIAGASVAFPVFGVIYGLTDLTVQFTTGTSLTDRIANGIDSSTGGLGFKY